MFLHIGDNEIVATARVIGIFPIETMRGRDANRRLEARARRASRWFKTSAKEDRSVVLTDRDEYLVSPVSAATLAKRLERLELNFEKPTQERGSHDDGAR